MNKFSCIMLLVFLSSIAKADILYQDVDSDSFRSELLSYDYNRLESEAYKRNAREDFFLGYVYYYGQDEKGIEKNLCKAYKYLESASSSGIADADFIIAAMYYNGQCVDKNIKMSGAVLEKSANEGYVSSQSLMGRAYMNDYAKELFDEDYSKARFWLKKAAVTGDAPSAIGLSYLYEKGKGGTESPEEAFRWRLKSTTLKYGRFSMGYFNTLARYYEEGYGTDVDFVQAYKYYDLCGSIGARGKRRVSKLMTVEQLNEAGRQSRQWQEDNNHYGPGYNGLQHQADGSYR